jgi:cytoskeletal protein CcmA (bactofilin family)
MTDRRLRRILDKVQGATTFIAPGTTVEGKLRGSDNILVCGKVIGDCELAATVTIAEGGSWNGRIQSRNVIVGGGLQGEVVAQGQIEIASTARIDGTLTGSTVAIAEGAVLEGEVRINGGGDPKPFTEKRGQRES